MSEHETQLDLTYADQAPPENLAAAAVARARTIRRSRQGTRTFGAVVVGALALIGALAMLDRPQQSLPAGTSTTSVSATGAARELLTVPDMVLSFSEGRDRAGEPLVARPATVSVYAPGTRAASLRWAKDGNLVLATTGSGSCPFLPFKAIVDGGSIDIETQEYTQGQGCNLDLVPTTITMTPPAGVSSGRSYEVSIDQYIHLRLEPLRPAANTRP